MQPADPFATARDKMVQSQLLDRGIDDERVLDAFRKVPRHFFVPEEHLVQAYTDHPLPIGGNQTISQPYIVALMSSQLDLRGDEKVLEIGTGSGYQTAILAELSREVYTVELIEELSLRAGSVFGALGIENVSLHVGDGSVGLREFAPYDRIIITAAVPALPAEIQDQLRVGGKMVAPMGGRWRQTLQVWERRETGFIKEKILPVVFVPLRGKHGWQE